MKFLIIIFFLAIAACNNGNQHRNHADHHTQHAGDQTLADSLIIPGKQVGSAMVLERLQDSVLKTLGKADATDAAMGKVLVTYFHPDSIDLFFAYRDTSMREKDLKQITLRSGSYQTKDKVKLNSNLSQIIKAYPKGKIKNVNGAQYYELLEDGISFGISNEMCKSIIIYKTNQAPNYNARY